MEYVLRTNNLVKRYKEHTVVDNVSINISRGEIYGFLGQNGAGKTTTLRMVTGLIKPTSGTVELFGKEGVSCGDLEKIGSIIETPGFYRNLTAAENLDIHRKLMGIPGKECIEEVLSAVGILEARNKKVKNFSLGMRQRLAIGRALLNNPELLILDEPTNGLDPGGIKDIRNTILDLVKLKNMTVVISSHILSEVQQLASKVGIIHQGKLIEEIDYLELANKNRHYIKIKVDDDKKTSMLLEQKLDIKDYKVFETGVIRIYEQMDNISEINELLVQKGVKVKELTVARDSLEDYFLKLTEGETK